MMGDFDRTLYGMVQMAGSTSALSARGLALRQATRPASEIRPSLESPYLIKGWIERGTFSVLYGPPNVGKSFLALDMSLHVAARMPWRGHRVAKDAGPVLYLASEGGRGFDNRVAAWRQAHPEVGGEAFDRLYICKLTVDLHKSGDETDTAELIGLMRNLQPSLVVVDTLARAMGDGEENGSSDMGAFVRNVDRTRAQTDAHVMAIHHTGKDSSRGGRGHSSLPAAVDTEIELKRDGPITEAAQKKQREMTCISFAYQLKVIRLGFDQDGDEVTSCVLEEAEPPSRQPKLSGQQKVAMQAFADALAHHGERKTGNDMFPANRQCVPLDRWREYCDRHSLGDGEGESTKRSAFYKVKKSLQEKDVIRVVDGFVWRVEE